MADVSKLKGRRTLGEPPPSAEASTNLGAPEMMHRVTPETLSSLTGYERLDGRSLRRSNRVVQFATRVTPEFDRRVREIARDENLMIVEVLEKALQAYERQRPADRQTDAG